MITISYPKIRRLPIYSVPYRKEPMSEEEIKALFDGAVVVEEKIDGTQSQRDHGDVVVFYEYMEVRHEILYTKLPSYEIAFDVYDKKTKRFLEPPEKHEVLKALGYCYVPVIYIGEISYNNWKKVIEKLMNRPSLYRARTVIVEKETNKERITDLAEGVVVKNYKKQLFGKAVNEDFDEALRGKINYIRRGKQERNFLYQGVEWPRLCHPPMPKHTR